MCIGFDSGGFGVGTTAVTCTAVDQSGNSSICKTSITLVDTVPPSISCPPPVTAECTGSRCAQLTPPFATGVDVCGSTTLTNPRAACFPLGTSPIMYFARDASGNTSSCSSSVNVVDTEPPVVSGRLNARSLWPPNGKYRTVTLADCDIRVFDQCQGQLNLATANAGITCVSSDEQAGSPGHDRSGPDIIIIGDKTVKLLAARDGFGDGRVYKIGFQVVDGLGNRRDAVCVVTVPRDQSPGRQAVDSGVKFSVCR